MFDMLETKQASKVEAGNVFETNQASTFKND